MRRHPDRLRRPSPPRVGARLRKAAAISLLGALLASGAVRAAPDLSVTVLGDPGDVRVSAVREAVTFWNARLAENGSCVRLGPVRLGEETVPESLLWDLSDGVLGRRQMRGVARLTEQIPGQVVVVLSQSDLMSFGVPWEPYRKGLVVLRRADVAPLSLPNVARNTAAHELGHVLGLEHNADSGTLMCGRPAPCRPDAFASATARFFPLTPDERERLGALCPKAEGADSSVGPIGD